MTYQALLSNGENILVPVISEDTSYDSQDYVWQIVEDYLYKLDDTKTSILEISPSGWVKI